MGGGSNPLNKNRHHHHHDHFHLILLFQIPGYLLNTQTISLLSSSSITDSEITRSTLLYFFLGSLCLKRNQRPGQQNDIVGLYKHLFLNSQKNCLKSRNKQPTLFNFSFLVLKIKSFCQLLLLAYSTHLKEIKYNKKTCIRKNSFVSIFYKCQHFCSSNIPSYTPLHIII